MKIFSHAVLACSLKSLKGRIPTAHKNLLRQILSTCGSFLPVLWRTVRHFGIKNVRFGLYSAGWGKHSLISMSREIRVPVDTLTASNPVDVEEAEAYLEGPLAIERYWLNVERKTEGAAQRRKLERNEKNLKLIALDPRTFVLAIGFNHNGDVILEDGDTRLTIAKHHKIREVKAVVVLPVWWERPCRKE